MRAIVNLVGMTVSGAPGTGTITLNSAVTGFLTPAQAGVQDQAQIVYEAIDGSNKENGSAIYTASGTTLSGRVCINSSNSNTLVSLSSAAIIYFTVTSQELLPLQLATYGLGAL